MKQTARTRPAAEELPQLLFSLEEMRLPQMRKVWSERVGEAPTLRSPSIFRKMLAYKLQAAVYGDIDAACRKQIAAVQKQLLNKGEPVTGVRSLPLGTVLTREWKGRRHEVRVVQGGFRHDGATYGSLSEIARAIAGTRWNGPLFFGLRPKDKAA